MKPHLPVSLLTAVLAAFIALPANAVEVPSGYNLTYLNTISELQNYRELSTSQRIAFVLKNSLDFTPSGNAYWNSSTPLVNGGNVFFSSLNSDSPLALSFKDGSGATFSKQKALTFDTLSNLTFSTLEENAINLVASSGTLSISNVNDGLSNTVDVLFEKVRNTAYDKYSSATYYNYGSAISASNVSIINNGGVSFSANSAEHDSDGFSNDSVGSSLGGAIYVNGSGTNLTIGYNADVTFSNNSASGFGVTASKSGEAWGGAILSTGNRAVMTIIKNGDVAFTGNSASSSDDACGGAIMGGGANITDNGDVDFTNNSASSNTDALGGATYTYNLTISNNGDVAFTGNSASGHSFTCGGAIYERNVLLISDNGNISFADNAATSSIVNDEYGAFAQGGAIDAYVVRIRNNGDVSFSGNSASSNFYSYGGAICSAIGVIINNNGVVTFSGNSTDIKYVDNGIARGGAIQTGGELYIQGNESVLFEKNCEIDNGVYRLRSIYLERGTGNMYLSAKTGGNITFYDSVYSSGNTYINSDYTDAEGNTTSAKGDVIFSGKHAEEHLNEILAANNENRTATAEEILNSQTSEIGGNVYVNGGSLQIVDGAVLKVNGDTVSIEEDSNATLAVSDAELVAANATIEVGESATLQLSNGATVTAKEIEIAAGATLSLVDLTATEINHRGIEMFTMSNSEAAVAQVFNTINANLTFAAGSTLVTDGTGINMTEGSVLTFNATSEGEKINLVFTLGTEYGEDGLVQLFSNVDIVKFLMDGEEVDSSTTLLASDFFTGAGINENTTLHYDSTANVVYLQEGNNVVPEPTTATLSLLALAALAMRRRRK